MSEYKVPSDPAWCSRCIEGKSPCGDHRAPDGTAQSYAGRDVYEPTPWVLSIVGGRYRSHRGVDVCTGYDPRNGFWMQSVLNPQNMTNVSERAIGRTFHRVEMSSGARIMLRLYVTLGRPPTGEEIAAVGVLPIAADSLRLFGYLTEEGDVTPSGIAAAQQEDA